MLSRRATPKDILTFFSLLLSLNLAAVAQATEPPAANPLRDRINTRHHGSLEPSSSEGATSVAQPAAYTVDASDAASTDGGSLEVDGAEPVSAAQIQQLLDDLSKSEGLDSATKEQAVQQYQAALGWLNEAAETERKLAEYQSDIDQAADRIQSAKSQLAEPPAAVTLEIADDSTLTQLQEQLRSAEVELKDVQQKLNEHEDAVKGRGERKAELTKFLGETKRRLDEATKQLKAAPPAGELADLTNARRTALRTRIYLFGKRIDLYRAELRRSDALAQLFPILRDLSSREKSACETRVKLYQQLVTKHRRAESERQAREAQRQLEMAHPALKELARSNQQLAQRRTDVTEMISRISSEVQQTEDKIEELGKAFRDAEERVDKAGHSATAGVMLRKHREKLPNLRRCNERLHFVEREMPAANLERIELDDERSSLGNIDAAARNVIATLTAEDRANGGLFIDDTVRHLLATKCELLDQLVIDLDAYLTKLSELELRNRQLIEQRSSFLGFINENVLWIRSADPLTLSDVPAAAAGVRQLTSLSAWIELAKISGVDMFRRPVLAGLALLSFVLLVIFHARLRKRIHHLCTSRACQSGVRFLPTLEALLIAAILAAEWPMLLWFVAWRMVAAEESPEFALAVGSALQYVAMLLFLSEFVRELCRPGGLAESFFKWSTHGTRSARRETGWVAALCLPLVAIANFANTYEPELWSNSLGRISFILGMLVLAAFAHRMLGTRNNVLRDAISRQSQSWLNSVRVLIYILGIGVPLCLAALAAIGFYYSAQHLAIRLQATLGMLFAMTLVHALISRWFLLKRRALAMQQIKERQQQSLEAEPIDGSGTVVPVIDTLPDLSEIHGKLRLLLRHAMTVTVFLAAWMIWSDVLPAFRVLDRVEFWVKTVEIVETLENSDGSKTQTKSLQDVPTTLRHGLMAALLLIGTVAIGKNLPALLEITLLNRLPLDRGGRHAISVILQYTVALSGVLLAGRLLNITWSSIQWLAAGMTVGLGFGLQEIFANFVSGLILLFERPIRVGDVITLGDVTGTVTDIRIRATTVTNWDRKELIVPNRELITGRLLNWTLSDKTNRIVIELGLAYDTDAVAAREIILNTVKKHENVLADPAPNVTFEGFGNSALSFVVRAYVATLDIRLETINGLHAALHARLREANIEIAFPQLDLNLRRLPAEAGALGWAGPSRSEAA